MFLNSKLSILTFEESLNLKNTTFSAVDFRHRRLQYTPGIDYSAFELVPHYDDILNIIVMPQHTVL